MKDLQNIDVSNFDSNQHECCSRTASIKYLNKGLIELQRKVVMEFLWTLTELFQMIAETNKASNLKCDSRPCCFQLCCQKSPQDKYWFENSDPNRQNYTLIRKSVKSTVSSESSAYITYVEVFKCHEESKIIGEVFLFCWKFVLCVLWKNQ